MDGEMEGGRASGREGRGRCAFEREASTEGFTFFSVAMHNRLRMLGLMLCLIFSLTIQFSNLFCPYILLIRNNNALMLCTFVSVPQKLV